MDYSPILAIVTAAFEIVVAVWALRGPGERRILCTTSTILLLLAAYQIAEVAICANVTAAGFTPRLAFVIVTWLPALGLLLIAQLSRPRSRTSTGSAYAMLAAAAGIVVWIVVDRSFASASVCNAVYARYTHAMPRFLVYSSFYCLGLLGMIVFSGYGAMRCRDPRRQRQLIAVFVGTVAFLALALLRRSLCHRREGHCLRSCVTMRCCLPSRSRACFSLSESGRTRRTHRRSLRQRDVGNHTCFAEAHPAR